MIKVKSRGTFIAKNWTIDNDEEKELPKDWKAQKLDKFIGKQGDKTKMLWIIEGEDEFFGKTQIKEEEKQEKKIYEKEELEKLTFAQLREIGYTLNVCDRSKKQIIIEILKAQEAL